MKNVRQVAKGSRPLFIFDFFCYLISIKLYAKDNHSFRASHSRR